MRDASRSSRNAVRVAMGRCRRQVIFTRRNAGSVRRSRVVLAPRPWRLSRRPVVALATVAKKAVHRGEHEVSRQTIARGRLGCPGCTCSPCPCASAYGMPVRSGARDLWVRPAPSLSRALCSGEGQRISRTRVKTLPRERERMILPCQLSFRLNPVSIRNKY
jgi:hypothetical protein